jgi:hypothetical protein
MTRKINTAATVRDSVTLKCAIERADILVLGMGFSAALIVSRTIAVYFILTVAKQFFGFVDYDDDSMQRHRHGSGPILET